MTNSCPVCLTVLSDLEGAARSNAPGISGTSATTWREAKNIWVVATTRPVPRPGDTTAHPEDERFKHLVTRRYHLCNREIPIIADETVALCGAVKITLRTS